MKFLYMAPVVYNVLINSSWVKDVLVVCHLYSEVQNMIVHGCREESLMGLSSDLVQL